VGKEAWVVRDGGEGKLADHFLQDRETIVEIDS
jgi:hypothetical protein